MKRYYPLHSLVNQWYSFLREHRMNVWYYLFIYWLSKSDQFMDLNTFDGFWFIGFTVIIEEDQIVSSLAGGSLFKLALGLLFFFFGLEFIIVICGKVRSNRNYLYTSDVGLHYMHSKSYMIKRRLENIRVLSHVISNLSLLSVSLLRDWMSRARQ